MYFISCSFQDNIDEMVYQKESVTREKDSQFEKGKEKVCMQVTSISSDLNTFWVKVSKMYLLSEDSKDISAFYC